jgi:hypothetical protein
MKLLLCKKCTSVFNLTHKPKTCECGASSGYYTDNLNAVHSGPSIPIGFANRSFLKAIRMQEFLNEKESGNPNVCCKGEEFTAFTIPEWAETIEKV